MKRVRDEDGNAFEVYTDTESNFPWGQLVPEGGFRVGDQVGLIYSDHEEYVFDNPTGVVVAVEGEWFSDEPSEQTVTVEVQASIGAHRVYLMAREIKSDQ